MDKVTMVEENQWPKDLNFRNTCYTIYSLAPSNTQALKTLTNTHTPRSKQSFKHEHARTQSLTLTITRTNSQDAATHQEVALVVRDELLLGRRVVADERGNILPVHEVLEAGDVDAPRLLQKS